MLAQLAGGAEVEQIAAINIVKDKTDFTVEGWKIAKEIPTWVLGYDDWVNDVPNHLHGHDTDLMNWRIQRTIEVLLFMV